MCSGQRGPRRVVAEHVHKSHWSVGSLVGGNTGRWGEAAMNGLRSQSSQHGLRRDDYKRD
jgi:hypothetical protein